MSFDHSYSDPTVVKALHWLNQQPDNWAEHIKDSNIAVKMYLKSQKQNKAKESSFKKEIKQFLKKDTKTEEEQEPTGAFLRKNHKPLFDPHWTENPKISPSADSKSSSIEKEEPLLKRKEQKLFSLDEKSLEALKKTIKELNIHSEQEALRMLIQLGRKNLEKLISSSTV